jgi:glycosyltransferase involved in cell wall biosynthesis
MSFKKNIIFLGSSGFPYGLAEVQKIILISKSLHLEGNNVTVICNKGVHTELLHPDLKPSDIIDGIKYIYTSGSPFRDNRFFIRNVLKIKGRWHEILIMHKTKKNKRIDLAILSTDNFFEVLYYSILSKLFRFKTALNYVEFESGKKKKWYRFDKLINDKLFDKYAIRLSDAVLPISDFLIKQVKKVSPHKKFLKIPGLTDFEKYNGIEFSSGNKYFLFCGSTAYTEIILFCIDSFGLLYDSNLFDLYLVVNGNQSDLQAIKEYVNKQTKREKIRMFSRLSEKDLYTLYKNAAALLIPLRPTLGDVARFPHKIGEYMASGNPVISTNYGEIKEYFTDMENMLLAENYDVNQFAEKMQFVINDPAMSKKIGEKGKNIAYGLFHFKNKAKVIDDFLESLLDTGVNS